MPRTTRTKNSKEKLVKMITSVDVTGFTHGEMSTNQDWHISRGYNLSDVAPMWKIKREYTLKNLENKYEEVTA